MIGRTGASMAVMLVSVVAPPAPARPRGSLAPAQARSRCTHFCKGGIDLGLGFGGGTTSDGDFSFSLSGNGGYFVLDGVVLGASVVYQSKPLYVLPEAYLRVYPFASFTDWSFAPFALAKFGRLFGLDSGFPDANIGTAGFGLAWFLTERLAFQLWFAYRFILHDAYQDGWDFGGGLSFTL